MAKQVLKARPSRESRTRNAEAKAGKEGRKEEVTADTGEVRNPENSHVNRPAKDKF